MGFSNGNRSAWIAAACCSLLAISLLFVFFWMQAEVRAARRTRAYLERLTTGTELGAWQIGIERRLEALEKR